jgi:membrane peptidoglycan carboxypeptidase
MVMGLLAAGLLIPAAGAAGSIATSGVTLFDNLPGDISAAVLAQQSRILDATGKVIATPQDKDRIIVTLKDIAPIMQKAQIAIEDNRFYEHGGVDPRGIARALVSNAQGGAVQGASTLTQQYVKMTLEAKALRNNNPAAAKAAAARNYSRKLQELKYAVTLEQKMTKDEILAGYFNIAYYGDRAYGIEAAAEHYFSTTAKKLTLAQSALLAGLVQNPSTTDPVHYPAKAQARRDVVLDRMHTLRIITDEDWTAAKAIPVKKMLKVKQPLSNCAASPHPYFCSYVMAYLETMPELGSSVPERIKNITQGGLTIRTTLDPALQKMALQQLTAKVPVGNNAGIGSAASVVQPGTGRVLAMVQNTTYTTGAGSQTKGLTELNWNADRAYGGENGFQFGSTAKMYAIVTALENGIPVNGTIPSKFATPTTPAIYTPQEQGKCGSTQDWAVRNDEAIGGTPLPFTVATAKSVNTAFASLVLHLGTPTVRATMTRMGLHSGDGSPIACTPASVTLGAGTTTPLTLATSYATLAAEGKYCPPNPILSITPRGKKPLKLRPRPCKQVIDPDIAKGATRLLTNVITSGTGTGASLGPRPAAGKTGTTDNHYQSWFVGFTPQLATAVWVGTPYRQFRMKNVTLAGTYYGEVFGGTISAPIWQAIMTRASQGMPFRNFNDPSTQILNGSMLTVPDVHGLPASEATQRLTSAGFSVQIDGHVSSNLPQDTVVYTSPSRSVASGTTVYLYLSAGPSPRSPKQPSSKPSPSPTPTPTKTKPSQ